MKNCLLYIPKADPAPAHRARAPLFEHFKGCIFENFESITRKNFVVINMQCEQYVLYSQFLLKKGIGYVWKDIKTNFRPKKLYRTGTAPPGS